MTQKKTNIFGSTLFLLIGSIFLQSFSFLSIKISTIQEGYLFILLLVFAFVFLAMRAVVWQMLLKTAELSKIYPYASLVQVLILFYSVAFFHEKVSLYNIAGLLIMLSGIYYMSRKELEK